MARHFDAAIVTVATLLFPSVALGGEITFRAICEPPQGLRISYGDRTDLGGNPIMRRADGPLHEDDAFSNVRPVFYVDSDRPGVVVSIWSDALPDDLIGIVRPDVRQIEAGIVRRSEVELAAVQVANGATWAYSFFPKMGGAFFTRLGHWPAFSEPTDFTAFGAVYFSRCDFG